MERLSGFHIMRRLPHGVDLFIDLRRCCSGLHITTVFDVGANVGQSAAAFAHRCPEAIVFAFEPLADNLTALVRNTAHQPRIRCHHMALGDVDRATSVAGAGVSARIADDGGDPTSMQTLDGFCAENGVAHIGFLKIDTEGYDHRVLKGASRMLAAQQIDVVQVEAGMNPGNADHVPLEDMKCDLEACGYRLFGLYDQVQEWPAASPVLRRVNAVFISPALAAGKSKDCETAAREPGNQA
jgi:FkbM family methyltransferase